MDRKEFIKLVSAGAVCGGTLSMLTACATVRYVDARESAGRLSVDRTLLQEEPFVMVRYPGRSAPIWLGRHEDGSHTALFMECTHRQCTVEPTGETFTCPCHGSRFDREGAVLEGPARRSLQRFPVSENEVSIHIELPE